MNNTINIQHPKSNRSFFSKLNNRFQRIFFLALFRKTMNFILIKYILYKYNKLISEYVTKQKLDINFSNELITLNNIEYKSTDYKEKNTTVFVFYLDANSSKFLENRNKEVHFSKFNELDMLSIFCDNINENYKNLEIMVFTDLNSHIPKNICANIVRLNFDTSTPMYSRNKLMNLYVNSNKFYQNTIFLDWDIILNFNPDSIFNQQFDIAVTYRKSDLLMPINEGVLFVKYENKKNVILFFNNLNYIYNLLSENYFVSLFFDNILKWRGGQLSLAFMIFWKKLNSSNLYINNFKYLVLDSDIYNFTPNNNISVIKLKQKKIIHLKGWLKKYGKEVTKALRS